MLGEDLEQKKQQGSRAGLWTKWQAKKEQAKEQKQESHREDSKPEVQRGKGCWQWSKEGHITAECLEWRRAANSLLSAIGDKKRQHQSEPCQVKRLLSTVVLKTSQQQVWEPDQ